jgi:hypothetical protein
MHLSMWCIPERRGLGQALRARVNSAELGGRGGAAALVLGGVEGLQRGGNAGARGGARGGAAKQQGARAGGGPGDDVAVFGVPGRSEEMHGAGGGRDAPRGGETAAGGGGGGFVQPREHVGAGAGAGAGAGRGGQHKRHDSQDRGLDDILSMP